MKRPRRSARPFMFRGQPNRHARSLRRSWRLSERFFRDTLTVTLADYESDGLIVSVDDIPLTCVSFVDVSRRGIDQSTDPSDCGVDRGEK